MVLLRRTLLLVAILPLSVLAQERQKTTRADECINIFTDVMRQVDVNYVDTLNYENLIGMYYARKSHKLAEWHTYCDFIKTLPYASDLILVKEEA